MPLKRLFALATIAILAACTGTQSSNEAQSSSAPGAGKVAVVTTISTLDSFVQGVGGDLVTVDSIVPIGASPETYQPAPQDVAKIAKAQLLVKNGAGLEEWLGKLLENTGSQTLEVVDCTQGLPVKNLNPHLWMDPVLAQQYVLKIRDALSKVDPAHADRYEANAVAYNDKLEALRRDVQAQIDTIPPSHRFMIVFHNAWQYYNDRFGITTLGFVERNPGQEPNPQQIAQLIDLAKAHGVHGVFSEPEYSPKILQAIAQGAGIKVVENLYDDSIGTDPRVSNYIAMLEYDTGIIVGALK